MSAAQRCRPPQPPVRVADAQTGEDRAATPTAAGRDRGYRRHAPGGASRRASPVGRVRRSWRTEEGWGDAIGRAIRKLRRRGHRRGARSGGPARRSIRRGRHGLRRGGAARQGVRAPQLPRLGGAPRYPHWRGEEVGHRSLHGARRCSAATFVRPGGTWNEKVRGVLRGGAAGRARGERASTAAITIRSGRLAWG